MPKCLEILSASPVRSVVSAHSNVIDVLANSAGQIFVSDGIGVAVYGASATGNASPDRYIKGTVGGTPVTPGVMALDSANNLYVTNVSNDEGSSIAVFGPNDNGTVTPARVISGPDTLINPQSYPVAMATDNAGNLYVLCLCAPIPPAFQYSFEVLEYAAGANGNAAPIRSLTTPGLNPYTGSDGLAVDTAGTVYVSAGTPGGTQTVFEFAASLSGNVSPTNTITYSAWTDSPQSRMAVH